MRFVANLADPDDTRLVNFMGQSGHPASPHYADQFEAWRTARRGGCRSRRPRSRARRATRCACAPDAPAG